MHAVRRRQAPDGLAAEADRSCIRRQFAEELRDQRRLAGAVRADQRMDLAGFHRESDVLRGKYAAKPLDQIVDLQNRRHSRLRARPATSARSPPFVKSTTRRSTRPRPSCQFSVQEESSDFQEDIEGRADERAAQTADATENNHDHQFAGPSPCEHVGADIAHEIRHQGSSQPRPHARDDKGHELVAIWRQPQRGHPAFVLPEPDQHQAELRVHDAPVDEGDQGGRREDHVVHRLAVAQIEAEQRVRVPDRKPVAPAVGLQRHEKKKIICAKASVIMMNWTPLVLSDNAPISAAASPLTAIASSRTSRNWSVVGKMPKTGSS